MKQYGAVKGNSVFQRSGQTVEDAPLSYRTKTAIQCADTADFLPGLFREFGADYLYHPPCCDSAYLAAFAQVKTVAQRIQETSGVQITGAGGVGAVGRDGADMVLLGTLLHIRTPLTDFHHCDVALLGYLRSGFLRIQVRVRKRLIFVGKHDIHILSYQFFQE